MMGIAPDSEYRYRAGIIHVLGEAAEDGHCFLPYVQLTEKVVERLAIAEHQPSPGVITQLLFQMAMDEQLTMQGHRQHQFICYQLPFFNSEQNLAKWLHQLLSRPMAVDKQRVQAWIDRFTAALGMGIITAAKTSGRDGSKRTGIDSHRRSWDGQDVHDADDCGAMESNG